MAVATLIVRELKSCQLFAIASGRAEEAIAIDAFEFDTGLRFSILQSSPEIWKPAKFDLFLTVADNPPVDLESTEALRRSRRVVMGVLFASEELSRGASFVDGNDTSGLALAVLGGISSPGVLKRRRR